MSHDLLTTMPHYLHVDGADVKDEQNGHLRGQDFPPVVAGGWPSGHLGGLEDYPLVEVLSWLVWMVLCYGREEDFLILHLNRRL